MSESHAVPLYAAVELGSNGVRMHVASCEAGVVRVQASLSEPIRLGTAGPDGAMEASTMRRALACLRQFREVLQASAPRALRVVATSALRGVCETPAFLPAASAAIGHPVELIGSEEEGRLVYLGVAGALGRGAERRLVLDIGGGSTEIVKGHGAEVELVQSFGVGALRHGLAFFGAGISQNAFEAALASARSRYADCAQLPGMHGWECAYGASGTVRALAELAGEPLLDAARLQALRRTLAREGERMLAATGEPAIGAAQLAGGLALLLAMVEELGIEAVIPVRAGLRAGVIRELYARHDSGARQDAPYPECA